MKTLTRRWITAALSIAAFGFVDSNVWAENAKNSGVRTHGVLSNYWAGAAQEQTTQAVATPVTHLPPVAPVAYQDVMVPTPASPAMVPDAHANDCGPAPCDDCLACDCPTPLWIHRSGIFADALFLRPGNVDIIYAQEVTGPTPADSPTGPLGRVGLDNEMGFRFGLTHALSDCSSLRASYTWFDADTSDTTIALPGNVLNFAVGDPSVDTVGATSIESSADYRITFQQVDLDYRSLLYGTQNTAINYFAGLRYANLDQEFLARQDVGVPTGLSTVRTDVNFDGFGIGFGLDGEKRVSDCGFLLYGNGSASFVSGEFKSNFSQTNQFGTALVATDLEDYRVVSILQTELGFGWVSHCGRLRATAGYQFAGWFNTITTGSYIDGVQTRQFNDISETITFDGVVSRIEWRY
jgi:hypothetical protein